MKTRLFTRALLVIAALFTGVSLFAGSTGNETKCTSPVYVTLNREVLQTGRPVHLTIQIENPLNVTFTATEVTGKDVNGYITESRTSQAKDGKVDVDIIIRGGQLNPDVLPVHMNHTVRIRIFDIEYITVDNISGVYGTQESPPNGGMAAKITRINYTDETGTGAAMAISQPEVEIAPIISTHQISKLTDVTLYPNPVRDGNLNLSFSDENITISLITVHNAVGALVYQTRPASAGQKISLNLENLNTGIYFVRLETGSGEIVKKFNITR